jgi:hypothetical protein
VACQALLQCQVSKLALKWVLKWAQMLVLKWVLKWMQKNLHQPEPHWAEHVDNEN